MTCFTLLRAVGFALSLYALPSWACVDILQVSQNRIEPQDFIFRTAQFKIQKILDNSLVFPITTSGGSAWTMVFDPDNNTRNEPHVILGYLDNHGKFSVRRVVRARRGDEVRYFKKVADMNRIDDLFIDIGNPNYGCGSIRIPPWAQVKLWLKHKLLPEDVRAVLQSATGPKIYDDGENKNRFSVKAKTENGRFIEAVVEEQTECPHTLITAFVKAGGRR